MRCRMTLLRLLVFATLTTTDSSATAQIPRQGSSRTKNVSQQPGGRTRVANAQLSDQDCGAFAQAIADAINAGDRAAFNALIDWDSLFDAALASMNLPRAQRQDIMKQLKRTTDSETGFTSQLLKNGKAGAKFNFLRARQNQGRQVVEYRMILPEGSGGVSYFEFVVKRFADGKVRAADIYVYTTAELLSTTFHRALLPLVASLSRTFLDKLLRSEQDLVRDLPKVPAIVALINQGKSREALAALRALGPETQKEKSVLLLRLRAAQDSDEKQYTEVLEDFRKLFPRDPCLDLLLIDYYTLKKNFPKALESVDRLDMAVGGDPYLNLLRAGLSEMRADLPEAERFAKLAIEQEPTLLQAYFYLIGITMKEQKYEETLAILKKQDQSFKLVYNDFKTLPAYAGFAKSPQYQEWLEYLAHKPTGEKADPGLTPAGAERNRTKTKAGSGT